MANTKQQGAINAAQSLIQIMQSLQTIRGQAKSFLDTYNSEQWSTIWNALQTYALTADGAVGVADATPNAAHPTVALNKSATALLGGVTLLQQFLNFCQNQAAVQAQYSQTIDDLSGF